MGGERQQTLDTCIHQFVLDVQILKQRKIIAKYQPTKNDDVIESNPKYCFRYFLQNHFQATSVKV